MPNRDKACVLEMSRKKIKCAQSEIFHDRNIILGSITDSQVEDTVL